MRKDSIVLVMLISLLMVATSAWAMDYTHYDFGGETVTIGLRGAAPEVFKDGPERARFEEVEERFNCKIEFFSHEGWRNLDDILKTDVLAGDTSFDVFHLEFHWVHEWDMYEFLYPLEDVFEDKFWGRFPSVGPVSKEDYTIAGTTYAIPWPRLLPPNAIWWNQDIFENEGLPNLYDLVEADEWDWDAIVLIAEQASRDTTGDGSIDQFGLVSNFQAHANIWAASNDALPIATRDGREVFVGHEEPYIETLEWYCRMHDERVIWTTEEGPDNLWGDGFNHMAMFASASIWQVWRDNLDITWGVVPLPKGPRADTFAAPSYMGNVFAAPITAQNIRPKFEVILALFEVAAPYTDVEAYEEALWEEWKINTNVPDMRTLEMWQMIHDITTFDFTLNILDPVGDGLEEPVNKVIAGEISAAAAMEAIRPEAQARLDDLFN